MPTSDWSAAVSDVGNILRARTTDKNGVERGTFTSSTRPTEQQVIGLIDSAVDDLSDKLMAEVPMRLWGSAGRLVALDAALHVELSYFPEQVASGRSPYAELKVLYDERLTRLLEAVNNDETASEIPGAGSPSYAFPANTGGMVGWRTEF